MTDMLTNDPLPQLPAPDDAPAADAGKCKDLHSSEKNFSVASDGYAGECNDSQFFDDEDSPLEGLLIGDDWSVWDDVDADPERRKLTDRQRAAIEMLVLGKSDVDVADRIGVHAVTIWRWKQQPAFRAALEQVRQFVFGSSRERLRDLVPKAIDVLRNRLLFNDAASAVRLLRLVQLDRPEPADDSKR